MELRLPSLPQENPVLRTSHHLALAGFAALATAPASLAQLIDHSFDQGANPDGWVAWDSTYSSVQTNSGNPFEQLILDNIGGASTCQFVFVEPTGPGPFEHSGNWRAAGVNEVRADLNIRSGRYGGIFCVFLADDMGTPNDRADDCYLILIEPAPTQAGWNEYVFALPSADTTPAPGWFLGGSCANGDLTQRWNDILVDVDYMLFVLDANPGQPCITTFWDLGIDNISVQTGDLGSVYCTSTPNSTGEIGQIEGVGSNVIASNDLTLNVTSLPQGMFGIFVMGRLPSQTPLFDGVLCLQNPLIRFNQILQVTSLQQVSFSPSLTSLPQGATFSPGETWRFQFWHRDLSPTPSANLSEALAITFQ